MNRPLRIGVFGGAECSSEAYKLSVEVGRLVAENRAILYCGGKSGVMEGVCRGARNAGGVAVGILPDGSGDEGNPFVTIPVATGAGSARNAMLVNSVDVGIAIAGSHGTLSEIAHALRMGKPVIGLQTWEIPGVIKARSAPEAVQLAIQLGARECGQSE